MKELFKGNKALKTTIKEIAEVAEYLWQRGWAERNAGNISVNINDIYTGEIHNFESYPFFELDREYPLLTEAYFFVTGTGKRMRDLSRKPMKNTLLIRLNKKANGYWIISQKKKMQDNFMPTSELPSHLSIHELFAQRGSNEKVVLHTHANELVALTQLREYCNEENLNNLLWGMHPETMVFVPKGVGFVPYKIPGSVEIAEATIEILKDRDVALWEKHGVFAVGDNVFETFDMIDILAKSARIFFMCSSSGLKAEGLTTEQLNDLKELSSKF
ncbi:MAG: rhamnulose-1-phosphate aldolase [Bacteroidales bacterium]|nr:rhamnulose-1-phosphate aldolase [Bacteroidales bacterium]